MKTFSPLHPFFLAGLIFLAATSVMAGQSGNIVATQLNQRLILVEDLSAEYHSESGIIIVTAKIRNNSQAMIRGYVTIYLLSGEGKKIHAYQEEVNGGEVFAHGVTVDLKATSKISDITKIASISVDFTPS